MTNRLWSCAALLYLLATPGSGRAEIVYEYTGNLFASATGQFSTNDSVAATVTFDTTPVPNSTFDISNIVRFQISAGPLSFDSSMPDVAIFAGDFNFDADGVLSSWRFDVLKGPQLDVGTYNYIGLDVIDFAIDLLVVDSGQVLDNAGRWQPVPEPAGVVMFSIGACLAAGLGWQRRRRRACP